jgi:hypothetical protein
VDLAAWRKKYEEKAEKLIILPGFQLYYKPDKGFFYWAKTGHALEIDHTCTNDFKWAEQKAAELAREHNCSILRTSTHRDPAAYTRLTKAKINLSLSGIRPNGKFYWVFEKSITLESELG